VSAPAAALVNGFSANALDIDDGYREVCGHPGAVVFPAVLAIGESLAVTGRALLEALVVGYEVAIRAGLALRPSYGDVYHCSGSWGAIGAAAACGRLLQLDAARLAHALGIAEAQAPLLPTLREVAHPAMTKDGVAWGAFGGVVAARLAERGFTGLPAVFDLAPDVARGATLGSEYLIQRLYVKPYPCCRWFQPAIEGIRAVRAEHGVGPEDIAGIEVATFAAAVDGQTRAPRSQEEAEYSLPYCVAAVAVHGTLGRPQVSEPGWRDPRVLDLAHRVRMSAAPDLEARFPAETLARVTVVTRQGRRLESGVHPARGGADDPLSDAELRAKYDALLAGIVAPPAAEALAAALQGIDELKDVRELVALLQG
jgi:2-methylcitrate dehydratase PrpD